ncbi:MAG: RNase adapter RapZ, partial [Pseudomonadales bacterium]
ERWLPRFEDNHRVYMTVGLGCTGGQHRSVYMAERLGSHFEERHENVLVRHRELDRRR